MKQTVFGVHLRLIQGYPWYQIWTFNPWLYYWAQQSRFACTSLNPTSVCSLHSVVKRVLTTQYTK